jgi:pimeloyl-ACP methyl ester carboxylesterase
VDVVYVFSCEIVEDTKINSMDSNTISTFTWGNGDKTIVFLHYFGGAASSWQWVAKEMPDYRCVTLNLPGFGGTSALPSPSIANYAEAVIAELNYLEIDDYILVGHSMGGKIALQVAISATNPPQQLVLIAPSPPTQEPMPEAEKERLLNNHPSRENAETTVSQASKKPLNEKQQALAIQTHMIVESSAWRWWLLEGMNQSIAAQMSQLQTPVTVLASKDDPVILFDTIQEEVLQVIPNASLVTTQDTGHLIPLEDPSWVATQLEAISA